MQISVTSVTFAPIMAEYAGDANIVEYRPNWRYCPTLGNDSAQSPQTRPRY